MQNLANRGNSDDSYNCIKTLYCKKQKQKKLTNVLKTCKFQKNQIWLKRF